MLTSFPQDRRVTLRLRKVKHHGLIEQLEPLHFLNGTLSSRNIIEYHESLPFGFQIFLCDQIDDVAVFREDFLQGFFQLVNLYSLFEILDLEVTSDTISED